MTDGKLYDVWLGSLDWDLIIYSWGVGPDPDFILSSFTTEQCGFWSDTCYSNPEYDELYKEQQTTIDEDARQEIVTEMQQIIYRDTPEIVLWYPNTFEAWRSDRWTGFVRWPEPDGTVFWGNMYSARLGPADLDARSTATGGGSSGWVWLGGIAASWHSRSWSLRAVAGGSTLLRLRGSGRGGVALRRAEGRCRPSSP